MSDWTYPFSEAELTVVSRCPEYFIKPMGDCPGNNTAAISWLQLFGPDCTYQKSDRLDHIALARSTKAKHETPLSLVLCVEG